MNDIEQVVYKRMIGDSGSGGLISLLGDSAMAPVRIVHGYQNVTPKAPSVAFSLYAAPKNISVPRFTRDVYMSFNIYADNYPDISFRLMRLFDGIQHDLSVISGGSVQIGGLSSVFDFEGPDGFDESLEVQSKDLRFRFFAVSKAQNPI